MSSRPMPIEEGDISPEETKWVKDCIGNKTFTHVVPMALGSVVAMKFASMKGYNLGLLARCGVIFSSMVVGRLASIPSCLDAAEVQFPDGTIVATRRGAREKRSPRELVFAPESQEQMPNVDYNNSSKAPQSAAQQPSQYAPSASQPTYDDLRRRNRDDYTSRRTAPSPPNASRDPAAGLYPPPQSSRSDPNPYDSQYSQLMSSTYSDATSSYAESTPLMSSDDEVPSKVRKRKRVNVYGDEIED